MKKIIVAVLCVIMSLVVFGCGPSNEEKYTTLKNEVNAEVKAFYAIKDGVYGRVVKSDIPALEKALKERKAIRDRVAPKFAEMKKLAEKELKLTNDFEKYGKNLDSMNKVIEQTESQIENVKKVKDDTVKPHNVSDLSSKASKIFNE